MYSSSTNIITTAFGNTTQQALILLGLMTTLSIVVFLVGWGLRKLISSLRYDDGSGEILKKVNGEYVVPADDEGEYDSLHWWQKGGRLN